MYGCTRSNGIPSQLAPQLWKKDGDSAEHPAVHHTTVFVLMHISLGKNKREEGEQGYGVKLCHAYNMRRGCQTKGLCISRVRILLSVYA